MTIDEPTNLDSVIFRACCALFETTYETRKKVRLVGVRASNLDRAVFQRNLLEARQREKLDRVLKAADKLRDKVRLRGGAIGAFARTREAAETAQAQGIPGEGGR